MRIVGDQMRGAGVRPLMRSLALGTTLMAVLTLALGVHAQEKSLYRYTDADGRVVYSDRPPPPSVKDAQLRQAGGNFIETDKVSAATRQAMERFPVTLYAFSCGVLCEDAERLLQKRGIPYTFVNTQEQGGNEKLKKLTGALDVPTLQVGTDFAKGYQDAVWQQLLDKGGYSKDAGVRSPTLHTAAPPPSAEPEASAVPAAGNGAAPSP